MSSVEEVDLKLSAEELSDATAEEQTFIDAGLAALTPEQRAAMTKYDCLFIVRGYQTYDPRMEETIKAFQMIADWRDSAGFGKFLTERLPNDDAFHEFWPESVYGFDKHGHAIIGMRIGPVNVDGLTDMEEEALVNLQGQKMQAITQHKIDQTVKSGVQRYKHTVVVDLKGTGMGLLKGKNRTIIKRIFGVGGDYFPESVWKIYVINTPFIFRACWAIVKPWIHPITQAKVNIFGSSKDCVKRMVQNDGIDPEQLPDWCAGTNPGVPIKQILHEYIATAANGADDDE